jgi:hypothetical protein
MRTLYAMVAALSLGACAAQPPSFGLADMAAQIRDALEVGTGSCAGRAKCSNANSAAMQPNPSVQTARAHPDQRIASIHPVGFKVLEPASPPGQDRAQEIVAERVPSLNSKASCRADEHLAIDQNEGRCLSTEGSAHDQLAQKWTEFPSADRSRCARYTTAGGGGTYTDLLTCLEMELYVRNLHVKNRAAANQ